MILSETIIKNKIESLSVIGMAKNAGKTVTLNYLIKEIQQHTLQLALTSIGRDGEEIDAITATEKPKIFIPKFTLVANAESLIRKNDLDFEIFKLTNFKTPLGRIVIAKNHEAGYCQLSGPGSRQELILLQKELKNLGADLTLIDGAISRKSLASPALADATILATGAVIGNTIKDVCKKTAFQIELFKIESIKNNKMEKLLSEHSFQTKAVLINDKYQLKKIKVETILNGAAKIIEQISKDIKAVYVNGAVVDSFLLKLIDNVSYLNEFEIIVNDSTYLFLSEKIYNRFKNIGGKFKVLNEINLTAVTVNPFSPQGSLLNPLQLLEELGDLIYPIPTYEVVLGKRYSKKGVKNIGISRKRNL